MTSRNAIRLALAVAAVACALGASPALAAEVKGRIDQKCNPEQGEIVVPAGKIATDFVLEDLASGVNCGTGMALAEKGWGITTDHGDGRHNQAIGDQYRYQRQNASSKPDESKPLSRVVLPPGKYWVFVDGGKGAHVTVKYTLKAGK